MRDEALREARSALELCPVSKDALGGTTVMRKVAQIYVRVGEHDAAIDLIETLFSIPSIMSVSFLKIDSIWDPLRDHPRYKRLVEQHSVTVS